MLRDATFVMSEYLQIMSIEARFDVFQAIDGPNKRSFTDLQSQLSLSVRQTISKMVKVAGSTAVFNS